MPDAHEHLVQPLDGRLVELECPSAHEVLTHRRRRRGDARVVHVHEVRHP
jgi:hypothetical protein